MCAYCDTTNSLSDSGISIISKPAVNINLQRRNDGKFFLVVSVYEELDSMKGLFSNSPSYGYIKEINYCPICGRRFQYE